jgi:hypothetical protein
MCQGKIRTAGHTCYGVSRGVFEEPKTYNHAPCFGLEPDAGGELGLVISLIMNNIKNSVILEISGIPAPSCFRYLLFRLWSSLTRPYRGHFLPFQPCLNP